MSKTKIQSSEPVLGDSQFPGILYLALKEDKVTRILDLLTPNGSWGGVG